MKETICDNLQTIGRQIQHAENVYGRESGSVALLAVSKRKSAEDIRAALACGQRAFGENYAQEMADKAGQLKADPVEWHYIGPIQSNKTRLIAETAAWVHSVDRLKIARRLSEQRPESLGDLQVCVQLNVSDESSKSGVAVDEVGQLLEQIVGLPRLRLRGLMAIPAIEQDVDRQREAFARVRASMQEWGERYSLDTLSMGMSGDMQAAIAEGATIVRIGTAIFGARE